MNMSDEERFHELAHRTLAKEAQPAEEQALQALIAERPELKKEFEQMSSEAAAAREILPLLEDIQRPRHDMPPPPMRRLQMTIREVFDQRPEPLGELRELLARLENWAGRRIGAERDRVMELIASLRESISARSDEGVVMDQPLRSTFLAAWQAPQRVSERAGARATREMEEQIERRDAEFVERLHSLEARILKAEQVTQECREEVRALLEAFAREQEVRAGRKRAHSTDPGKPRE